MSPSKDEGKYMTSRTSMDAKSMDAKSHLDIYLGVVCFNALTIFNPIEEGKGVKWTLRW